MFVNSLLSLLGVLSFASLAAGISNPVYVITNAETPSLFRPGLTPVGQKRATDCLPALFSTLNIGKIIMCPENDESQVCFETLATTQPTATALGLPIDTSCGADENTDDDCVTDLLKKFAKNSTQSVLIVWDFQELGALLGEDLDLDTDDADADDGIHFDLVTVVVKNKIKSVISQNCTDIDGIAPATGVADKNVVTRRGLKAPSSWRKRREIRSVKTYD